jgi:CheY-like chemotaxis protein
MAPATAASVAEAIRVLEQAAEAEKPFQLVVADSQMPEQNGFDLAERIRQDSTLESAIVMMFTSGDRPKDGSDSEPPGVAACVLKPVKNSELFDAVQIALSITLGAAPKPLVADSVRRLPPLDVLLVEDSLVNQKLAAALLRKHGHATFIANNGREAVEAFETRQFDVVLMDVQMPDMDGIEATRAIRNRERRTGGHVPIVAMTAHALKGDRELCLAAGMDDYIAKPIQAQQLFATMESVLLLKKCPSDDA